MISPGRVRRTEQHEQGIGRNAFHGVGHYRDRALLDRVDQAIPNAVKRIEIDNRRQSDRFLGRLDHGGCVPPECSPWLSVYGNGLRSANLAPATHCTTASLG